MAFRTFRKKFRPRGRQFRNLAKKRRNWHQFNIDPCVPLEIPFCVPNDGCCTEQAKVVLLSNQELQDLYSDRCVVVRLLGELYFFPNAGTITSQENLQAWLGFMQEWQGFVGLRKGEISSSDDTASFDIWDDAHDDLADGRWRKTWQHVNHFNFEAMIGNNLSSSFELNLPVSTPDTHTYAVGVPGVPACSSLVSGSGSICIETTGEDPQCFACPQGLNTGQITFGSSTNRYPLAWRVPLNVRKRFPMRENEELYLMANFRHFGTAPQGSDVGEGFWSVRGNVRILTEF